MKPVYFANLLHQYKLNALHLRGEIVCEMLELVDSNIMIDKFTRLIGKQIKITDYIRESLEYYGPNIKEYDTINNEKYIKYLLFIKNILLIYETERDNAAPVFKL
jgi:hypothetical protein